MGADQLITASIRIAGRRPIKITSSTAGIGSYICVVTGLVMVNLFDHAAATKDPVGCRRC